MGKCVNHPNRETNFMCMKHNVYLCEECLKCRDPNIHCKFRPSCPIWFMDKRGGREIDEVRSPKTQEFVEEFTSAMFIPHTNLGDFPSVKPYGGKKTA